MNDNRNDPGNRKVIYFFLGFLILFAFAFSLGVIVGKELSESEVMLVVGEETSTKNPGRIRTSPENEPGIIEEEENEDQTSLRNGLKERLDNKRIAKEDSKDAVRYEESMIEDNDTEEIRKEDAVTEISEDHSILDRDKKSSKESEKLDQVTISTDNKKQARMEFSESRDTPEAVAALPPIEPGGKYTVQVGSFKNEKTAKEREKLLKSSGYPAFIKRVIIPEEGILYGVRIGTFHTRKSAKLYGDSLKTLEPGIKVVYITFND